MKSELVIVAAAMMVFCVGVTRAAEPMGAISVSVSNRAVPSGNWKYDRKKDPLTDEVDVYANARSINAVNLPPPYGGPQRLDLLIRKRPTGDLSVIIAIPRGQFNNCYPDTCDVHVRFDDDSVLIYDTSAASSNRPNILFINNAEGFVERLEGARRLRIQVEFFQAGRHTFNFNVAGLKKD